MAEPPPLDLGLGLWPGIAVTSQGVPYVAFTTDGGTTVTRIESGTLATPVAGSLEGNMPRDRGIEVGPDGTLHLVTSGVYYATGKPDALDQSLVANGDAAALTLDAEGAPHLSFIGDGDLRYARPDGAGGFSVEHVGHAAPFNNKSDLAVDPRGDAHIVYADEVQEAIYWTNSSGEWTSEALGFHLGNPVIVADAVDTPHIIRGDGIRIEQVTRDEQGWVTEYIADGNGSVLAALIDDDGVIHVAFRRGYGFAYASNWNGVWQTTEVAEGGADLPWSVGLGVDAQGAAHFVYGYTGPADFHERMHYRVLYPK